MIVDDGPVVDLVHRDVHDVLSLGRRLVAPGRAARTRAGRGPIPNHPESARAAGRAYAGHRPGPLRWSGGGRSRSASSSACLDPETAPLWKTSAELRCVLKLAGPSVPVLTWVHRGSSRGFWPPLPPPAPAPWLANPRSTTEDLRIDLTDGALGFQEAVAMIHGAGKLGVGKSDAAVKRPAQARRAAPACRPGRRRSRAVGSRRRVPSGSAPSRRRGGAASKPERGEHVVRAGHAVRCS